MSGPQLAPDIAAQQTANTATESTREPVVRTPQNTAEMERELVEFAGRYCKKQKTAKRLAIGIRLMYLLISAGVTLTGAFPWPRGVSAGLGVLLFFVLGCETYFKITENAQSYRLAWARAQSLLSKFRIAANEPAKSQVFAQFAEFREQADSALQVGELPKK